MESKKIFFLGFQVMSFLLFLSCFSCGRSPNVPEHLDHDFLFSSAEGLYRSQDLKMILSAEAAVPKDFYSKTESFKDYQKILDSKENLYLESGKANIFNLSELLKITTAEKGEKVKIFSSLDNIYIDPSVPFLNEYEILDYTFGESKSRQKQIIKKLLGNIKDFKGFPKTDYYILPSFLGNYLILYKLGPPDKIPYEELPLAKRIGSMLAVPLAGYPVEYCKAVKVLGSNNIKETLKFRPVCKGLQTAESKEYIRLQSHTKQRFQYQQKLDLFQRDFFDGKWLYFKTSLGSRSSTDNFKTAQLAQFQPSLKKLDVVEVNDLNQDDEKRVLFIPVEWKDYEIAKDSDQLNSTFSERLKDVNESHRPYLQLKFNELSKAEFHQISEGGTSLKSVVISKNYISFDIEVTKKGLPANLIKYAFKRYVKNQDYREKKWFHTDSLLFFPLRHVERKYYENLTDHSRADLDRFKRVIRFNPSAKEIVWHFSKQSSRQPWVMELAYKAERLINKAFEIAGKDSERQIKIRLDKNPKELGDIRYNILNLILSPSESKEQFTKAFNVADPFTGEVISAAANVWLTPILNEHIKTIRRYIRFHIYPPAWKMRPFSKAAESSIDKSLDTKNLQCWNQEPLGVTPFFHEKIHTLCKEISLFIAEHKGKSLRNTRLRDEEAVRSCAQKLAEEEILQSILKSFLQSFGLKEMLSSSFDSENFYTQREIQALFGKDSAVLTTKSHPDSPKYSSVMKDMDLQYPILSVPGKLDIAALRFLYFDKVDLKNGEVLEVPSSVHPENPQKSILETGLEQAYTEEELKKHKICGPDRADPVLCGKESYGDSLIEIAGNEICKLHNHLLISRNRYDADEIEPKALNKLALQRMYMRWEKYRDNILAGEGKSIADYSFLNPAHVAEYNQIIQRAEEDFEEFKTYNIARKILFDYFKRLAFAPVKRCIYKTPDGGYKTIALEAIEEKILLEHPETGEDKEFINCKSPIVQDWAEENLIGSRLVTEVGFFGKERRYLIRPNYKTDPIDKFKAFVSIHRDFSFLSSKIFQEPDLTAEYYKEWLDYAILGLDLNPYINKSAIDNKNEDFHLDRVLSYKIDTMEEMSYKYSTASYLFKNIWHFRLKWLKEHIHSHAFSEKQTQTEKINLFQKSFNYQAFSLAELRELADSIQRHPDLYNDFPFLTQLYEEFKQERRNVAFDSFIQKHSAVLYDSEKALYRFPYEDSESNVLSRLHRKYNEFAECVEDSICEDLEEKQAFIRLMLDTEDDFFQISL